MSMLIYNIFTSFPRYGICAESQPTIILFILGHFQQKVMIQFCAKIQKPYFLGLFGHFFPIFRKIRVFPKNRALSLLSLYGPLTSCKISKKTNESIPRKVHYRRTDARTDARTDMNSQDPSGKTGGPKIIYYIRVISQPAVGRGLLLRDISQSAVNVLKVSWKCNLTIWGFENQEKC